MIGFEISAIMKTQSQRDTEERILRLGYDEAIGVSRPSAPLANQYEERLLEMGWDAALVDGPAKLPLSSQRLRKNAERAAKRRKLIPQQEMMGLTGSPSTLQSAVLKPNTLRL